MFHTLIIKCMKKFFLISILMVFCMASFGQDAKKGAVIKFNETTFDFGEIKAGSGSVTHVFDFVNDGDEPLTVSNVKATCGCTVPKWTKEPIMPGQSGSVTVTYNSTKNATANPFGKSVTVTSNATPPQNQLTIRGHVVAALTKAGELSVDKTVVELGKFKKNKKIEKSFVITNVGDDVLNIKGINTAATNVKINVPKTEIAPNEQVVVEIVVETKDIYEKGQTVEIPLIISTDSSKTPQQVVKIFGTRK